MGLKIAHRMPVSTIRRKEVKLEMLTEGKILLPYSLEGETKKESLNFVIDESSIVDRRIVGEKNCNITSTFSFMRCVKKSTCAEIQSI